MMVQGTVHAPMQPTNPAHSNTALSFFASKFGDIADLSLKKSGSTSSFILMLLIHLILVIGIGCKEK